MKPLAPIAIPQERGFWHEFIRVQSDKFLLLVLIVFLHFVHAPDTLQATAVGGLIVLIQGQRFKLGG